MKAAIGATIEYLNASGVWTTIIQALRIDGPAGATGMEDVTTHDSASNYREQRPTTTQIGDLTIELVADQSDATHQWLAQSADGAAQIYRLGFSDGSAKWIFSAERTSFRPAAPVQGAYTASATLRVTGSRSRIPQHSGLIGDYDARFGVTHAAGIISAVQDLSGSNENLTPHASSSDVLAKADDGSKIGFYFDGAAGALDSASFTPVAQPNTVLIAFRLTSIAAAQTLFDGIGATNEHGIKLDIATGNDWGIVAGGTLQEGGTPDTTRTLLRAVFDGASSGLFADGSSTNLISATPGAEALAQIRLGATGDPATPATGIDEGYIYRVQVYNKALSAAEISESETAFLDEFG